MDIPPGSVIITPTELYAEMKAISTSVTGMRGDIHEISKALPDHESRIRALEKKVWWAGGLAAAAAAGATAAASQLLHAMGKG